MFHILVDLIERKTIKTSTVSQVVLKHGYVLIVSLFAKTLFEVNNRL